MHNKAYRSALTITINKIPNFKKSSNYNLKNALTFAKASVSVDGFITPFGRKRTVQESIAQTVLTNYEKMKKSQLFFVLLMLLIAQGCKNNSVHNNEFLSQVRLLFDDWQKNSPGGAAAIIKDGKVIYEEYFGMANLESNTPFSNKSITDIGSISKQFTACLIALLVEDGKLSIEDNIRKYLPELPEYANNVKIKNLLFHTSGIRDYEAIEMIQGRHYFEEHMTNQYVLDMLCKQSNLNFTPNSEFEYSNTNYILLATIIERISGKSLNEFATEKIFQPLKMKQTFFHINQGEDFVNKAIGYENIDNEFKRPVYRSHLIGDGGLYTSLEDMIKWDQNFYKNKLGIGSIKLLEQMKNREILSDGMLNNMAFAQIFSPHPFGQNSWSHGGSGGGYRSFYIRFEEAKFSVIVLSNSNEKNAFQKANEIVNLYFNFKPSQTTQDTQLGTEAVKKVSLNDKSIAKLTGYYLDKKSRHILNITYDEEQMEYIVNWLENNDSGYVSLSINDTVLVEKDSPDYTYKLDEANTSMVHFYKDVVEKKWKKLEPITYPLTKFKGSYYSPEIEHKITFKIIEGELLSENAFMDSLLRIGNMIFLDKKTNAIINFEMSDSDNMTGFTIDIPRGDRSLRNLPFKKLVQLN